MVRGEIDDSLCGLRDSARSRCCCGSLQMTATTAIVFSISSAFLFLHWRSAMIKKKESHIAWKSPKKVSKGFFRVFLFWLRSGVHSKKAALENQNKFLFWWKDWDFFGEFSTTFFSSNEMESFLDCTIFLCSSQQKRMSASESQEVFQEWASSITGSPWWHGELQQEQCWYLNAYQIDPTAL